MEMRARRGRRQRPGTPAVQFIGFALFLAGTFCLLGAAAETALGGDGRLRSVSIDGYFDPARNFLAATARLRFDGPAGDRSFWLAKELQLHSVRGGTVPAQESSRESGSFLVQCPAENELELNYSGRLAAAVDPFAGTAGSRELGRPAVSDDIRFLSYVTDYYPHPQLDFTPMAMTIRIPSGWNCLGSGVLRSVRPEPAANAYSFENPEAKGLSLVCGRFRQLDLLPGAVPIRLHGWPEFNYRNFFPPASMPRLLSFYSERFGPLPAQELNILFRRGKNLGGISYSGLIVLNIDESWALLTPRQRRNLQARSLLAMDNALSDLLAHELAHQWWGGIVSWQTSADNWLTEGLATYSSLIYLRERKGEKEFRAVLQRFRRSVKRYAGKGVPADGAKLKLLNPDIKVYQALVYVKPALMLAELADTIGEAELCLRLRGILKTQRCRNLGTEQFLGLLSGGDPAVRARLNEWICSRGLPKGR
jgi:hypothetical protein